METKTKFVTSRMDKKSFAKARIAKEQLSQDSREWLIKMMRGNRAHDVYFVTEEGLAA